MMTDGQDLLLNVDGRTLRHARRPVSIDPMRILTRFRSWRQPSRKSLRSVPRAGP
jgi:hypothetical protein